MQSVPTKINAISTLEHYIRVYIVTSPDIAKRILSGRSPKGQLSNHLCLIGKKEPRPGSHCTGAKIVPMFFGIAWGKQ